MVYLIYMFNLVNAGSDDLLSVLKEIDNLDGVEKIEALEHDIKGTAAVEFCVVVEARERAVLENVANVVNQYTAYMKNVSICPGAQKIYG